MTESQQASLEDVMVAMDVVDTLRHQRNLIARELDTEGRRDRLLTRLKHLYEAQGLEVPENVLLEGIDALEQERFQYTPVTPSWKTRLAKIWVSRGRWGKPVGFLMVVAIMFSALYWLVEVRPQWHVRAQLPKKVASLVDVIRQQSKSPEALIQAEQIQQLSQLALKQDNLTAAEEELAKLQSLNQQLLQEYTIRVSSKPNQNSGVLRVPPNNPSARNYYLIVEAVDPNNNLVKVPILNEEDNAISVQATWGLRVDEQTFYQIASDKKDDGIIQNNVVGNKSAGFLQPEFRLPTSGATITEW